MKYILVIYLLVINLLFSSCSRDGGSTNHSVLNSAPIADAGTTQSVKTQNVVQLNGSNSSDADSDTLTYKWSIQSKPENSTTTLSTTNSSHPTFRADVDGSYVIKLIVNDGTVDSSPTTVTIKATTSNSAPIADAGNKIQYTSHDVTMELDGSKSSDADNNPLTYSWYIKSKPTDSNATLSDTTQIDPTFYVDKNGTYLIELTVNDGTVDSEAVTITLHTQLTNDALRDLLSKYKTDSENTRLSKTIINADTSEVTDMYELLKSDTTFNLNIANWDTTHVENMSAMFENATTFNQDISRWNVFNVTNHSNFDLNTSQDWTSGKKPYFDTILSSETGKIWLDKNLGASQKCSENNDSSCYGDYYQWGRKNDGHQLYTSSTTETQAQDPLNAGHSDFIITPSTDDWVYIGKDDAGEIRESNWNPCPEGFRVPTIEELNNEKLADGNSRFNELKFASAGFRDGFDGELYDQDNYTYVWSSNATASIPYSWSINLSTNDSYRDQGYSVRCIKK